MCEEWSAEIPGYKTKTVQVGNCTVRIHRPILDDQEMARKEEQLKDALMGLIKRGTES